MQEALSTTEVFLIAMAIIFYCSLFDLAARSHRLLRAIVGGANHDWVLLGSGILGKAFPDYYTFVFSPPMVQSLNGIA